MNTTLLQKWLGLPAGSDWPPDDRTLLGLPPGPADPFSVEKRAMEMMDRLRPYQLAHPDLVTDAMNRLAQAMVALSAGESAGKSASVGVSAKTKSKPKKSVEPRAEADAPPQPPTVPTFEPVDFALPDTPPAPPGPEVVEAEVVESPQGAGDSVNVRERYQRTRPSASPSSTDTDTVTDTFPSDFAPPAPAGFVVPAAGRREAYRDLARLRRLRKAWRKLRASVADPAEQLPGAAEVCGFLEAVHEVRAALAVAGTGDDVFGTAGANVRAVVRHPLPLAVVRSLVPAQRQSLARDWAVGLAATETRYGAVRGFLLKDAFGRRAARRRAQTVRRLVARNPEWVLVGLTVLWGGVAAVRAVR